MRVGTFKSVTTTLKLILHLHFSRLAGLIGAGLFGHKYVLCVNLWLAILAISRHLINYYLIAKKQ